MRPLTRAFKLTLQYQTRFPYFRAKPTTFISLISAGVGFGIYQAIAHKNQKENKTYCSDSSHITLDNIEPQSSKINAALAITILLKFYDVPEEKISAETQRILVLFSIYFPDEFSNLNEAQKLLLLFVNKTLDYWQNPSVQALENKQLNEIQSLFHTIIHTNISDKIKAYEQEKTHQFEDLDELHSPKEASWEPLEKKRQSLRNI